MEKSEALEILDIEPSASDDEIEEKFRKLATSQHPDSGGDRGEMSELLKARDIAKGKNSKELQVAERVIAQYSDSLSKMEARRRDSEKTVDRLISRQTSKYRRFRQAAILFGGLFGAIIVFLRFSDFPPLTGSSPFLPGVISMSAMVLGMAFWMAHSQMERIKTLINDADEALEDKMTIIGILDDIGIDYSDRPSFSKSGLIDSVEEWGSGEPVFFPFIEPTLDFKSLANQVGSVDFSRLLIRKGLEKGILVENETYEEGQWKIRYQVNTPE